MTILNQGFERQKSIQEIVKSYSNFNFANQSAFHLFIS